MTQDDLIYENQYLNNVNLEIDEQLEQNQQLLQVLEAQKKEFSKYFSDEYYTMDDEEALEGGDKLSEIDSLIYYAKKNIDKLNTQKYSAYFGKVEFEEEGKNLPYYIGVKSLTSPERELPFVCDWRAPVSSLFYDYELGQAEFEAPDGTRKGTVKQKRQFVIKNGKMEKCFDSSLTIGDEILKDVLSQNSSAKMKNIVSTIQKQQNKIIRSKSYQNMVVQGVAGSGKTSIALHRIAFLLYQNKDKIKAEDILILSPNKLFSEYISDVLPELGEENMSQMSFFRLAQKELFFIGLELEKREDNLEELTSDIKRLNEVAYKNTYEFYESLQEFCKNYFDLIFKPKDLKFGETIIKKDELLKLYNQTYSQKMPAIRVEWLVDYIMDKINVENNDVASKIKNMLYPFFEETNVINIYATFLANIGMTMTLNNKGQIRYDDLAGILYITNYYFGLNKYKEVKYLIVDEMQDYSYVHLDLFNCLFNCNKIFLGDINQCLEKVMTQDDLNKYCEMTNSELVLLNKAYRSTYQITKFASQIKNLKIDCINRQGNNVSEISVLKNKLNALINEIINNNKDKNSIAILTENISCAKEVYELLNIEEDLSLNINYDEPLSKVCIMPSFMAKGLEFDVAIVIESKHTLGQIKENLKYVACTRAMHELYIIKIN